MSRDSIVAWCISLVVGAIVLYVLGSLYLEVLRWRS